MKFSKRNELEITDLNKIYLNKSELSYEILDSNSVWLDTGTNESLLEASQLVKTIEKRQNTLIGSPEILCMKKRLINIKSLKSYLKQKPSNDYYLSVYKQIKNV